MHVNLDGAKILKVGNKGTFYVCNEEGHFKVCWCEKINHYKVEELKRFGDKNE